MSLDSAVYTKYVESIAQQVAQIEDLVVKTQTQLEKLISEGSEDYFKIANTSASLAWTLVHLILGGKSRQAEKLKTDLSRIQTRINSLHKVHTTIENKEQCKRLNKAAAERIINSALFELEPKA